MSLKPRSISALALFASAALVAAAGCGGGDGEQRVSDGCSDTNSSVPLAAAALDADGSTLRIAYGGDFQPCQFAASLYKGRLYVELRKDADSEAPPAEPDCAIAHLDEPLPAGTRVETITSGGPDASQAEGRALIESGPDCIEVPEGQPAFIID